ncbi:hypothetical protein AB6A40_005890 [Gnathostoma spinigerum]|uniref:DUF7517 domain-containing protein n=1 Tax=Gnathostoma spinigerum TaxID=75299 RepID=A0ABD6EP23_9BILA
MSNCNVSGNIPNKPVSAVSDRKQYKENHFGGLPSARRSNSPQRPLSDQTGLLSRIAADDFLSSGKSETGTQTDDFLSYAYITEFLEESGILAASREAEAHASAESYQPVSKKDAELAEAVDFIVRFRHPNPITVNELSSLICGILGPSIRRFELPVSWANFVCRFCRNVWVDRISDDVCLRYGSSR